MEMGGCGNLEKKTCATVEPFGTHSHAIVSVVIVNFNGGPLLVETARSVLSSILPIEVFVVDNGSTDASLLSLHPLALTDRRCQIIENHANLGFARAANVALERTQGDYILLLNPDVVIKPDTLARMIAALAAYPDAGMAGCLLRNSDGTEQAGCRRSVPTPWRTLVRVFHLDRLFPNHPCFRNFVLTQQPLPETPVFLEAISGAFMLVRRKALENVGFLDEKYFLHCEDLDWCMRFRQVGWKILFVPNVEVIHYQGTCSKDRPILVLWHKHSGMIRFYRKFFRHQYPWPLMILVMVAVWTRFILLAGLALILPQESREPDGRNQEEVAIMSTTAQEISVTPPAAGSGKDTVEIDPMLVIASVEADHPYQRSS
ncbi:MAG: glycosyltransferase family 2 protein [Sulfuricaulis sp.]